MDEFIIGFFGWMIFSFLVAMLWFSRGHSYAGGFFVSFLLSPVLGLLITLVRRPDRDELDQRTLESGLGKRCPHCAEVIKAAASACRYCGRDLPPANAGQAQNP